MTKMKSGVDPWTGLNEDQLDEFYANDNTRRGYRCRYYWDIRHKSMTPADAKAAVLSTLNEVTEEDKIHADVLFRDFSIAGFFTKDTKLALQIIDLGCDFLFDNASGLWFLDLFGHHQTVMSSLQAIYAGEEDADEYIEDCRGFFCSGATGYGPRTIRMAENYNFPAELKTAFTRRGFNIWRLE